MNIQQLKDTLVVQTSSHKEQAMRQFIKSQVKAIPDTRISYHASNIYVTRGEALLYPCVVAHMDTVHDCYKDFQIYQTGDNLFAMDTHSVRQVGIGGDDKVGVFIALEMLRTLKHMKVVFFTNEEIGCVGSSRARLSFFEDCCLTGWVIKTLSSTEVIPNSSALSLKIKCCLCSLSADTNLPKAI